MEIEIILAIVGLLFSAYFSGSEIAFISANSLQMQVWSSQNKFGAKSSQKYLENKEGILPTILVGNTLANMLTTSYATIIFYKYYLFSYWLITILVSLAILIFGELIPKTLIRIKANTVSRYIAVTMKVIEVFLLPLTLITKAITNIVLMIFGSEKSTYNAILTREEFSHSLRGGHESGIITKREQKYIHNVMEFSDTDAGEIKTPRTDIQAVSEDADLDETKIIFIESGFSKLLIYRDSIDEIIGFIVLHDLFRNPKSIKDIIRDIAVYPESKGIFELFKDFQEKNISICVLVDEFGGTAGIVTMEDLAEEIFGEFDDEYDEDSQDIRQLANGDLVMGGRAEISDLTENYSLVLPEGDYETIAGFLLGKLNRFPEKGENIIIDNYEYQIVRATPRSIDYLRIHKIK